MLDIIFSKEGDKEEQTNTDKRSNDDDNDGFCDDGQVPGCSNTADVEQSVIIPSEKKKVAETSDDTIPVTKPSEGEKGVKVPPQPAQSVIISEKNTAESSSEEKKGVKVPTQTAQTVIISEKKTAETSSEGKKGVKVPDLYARYDPNWVPGEDLSEETLNLLFATDKQAELPGQLKEVLEEYYPELKENIYLNSSEAVFNFNELLFKRKFDRTPQRVNTDDVLQDQFVEYLKKGPGNVKTEKTIQMTLGYTFTGDFS